MVHNYRKDIQQQMKYAIETINNNGNNNCLHTKIPGKTRNMKTRF